MVEWAASRSVDPTDAVGDRKEPMVAVIDSTSSLTVAMSGIQGQPRETVKAIRDCLARGCPVVTTNSKVEGQWGWDEMNAETTSKALGTPVVWQGWPFNALVKMH